MLSGEITNFLSLQVIVVSLVRSSSSGFFGSFVRSRVTFSSSVTTVSAPFLASTDLTEIVTSFAGSGALRLTASSGGCAAATLVYVHELPSTSGRIFTPHAGVALPTGGP